MYAEVMSPMCGLLYRFHDTTICKKPNKTEYYLIRHIRCPPMRITKLPYSAYFAAKVTIIP